MEVQQEPLQTINLTIKNGFLYCVLGHIPLGCVGFNKPPMEVQQKPLQFQNQYNSYCKTTSDCFVKHFHNYIFLNFNFYKNSEMTQMDTDEAICL